MSERFAVERYRWGVVVDTWHGNQWVIALGQSDDGSSRTLAHKVAQRLNSSTLSVQAVEASPEGMYSRVHALYRLAQQFAQQIRSEGG